MNRFNEINIYKNTVLFEFSHFRLKFLFLIYINCKYNTCIISIVISEWTNFSNLIVYACQSNTHVHSSFFRQDTTLSYLTKIYLTQLTSPDKKKPPVDTIPCLGYNLFACNKMKKKTVCGPCNTVASCNSRSVVPFLTAASAVLAPGVRSHSVSTACANDGGPPPAVTVLRTWRVGR